MLVQTSFDFEALEVKTSAKLVEKIKRTYDRVKTSDEWKRNRDIQILVEEDEYTVNILMCFSGNLKKYEYTKSMRSFTVNHIGWTDIEKFFDIKMKNIEDENE